MKLHLGYHEFGKRVWILFFLVVMLLPLLLEAQIVKVDFNMVGRSESECNEPGYTPWIPAEGTTDSKTINGITFKIKSLRGNAFASNYFKAGIQSPYYARLGSDALISGSSKPVLIELRISGLQAGKHSLLTYHNIIDNLSATQFSFIDIWVDGDKKISQLKPGVRVTTYPELSKAFFEFNVTKGADVSVVFVADSTFVGNKMVAICGFELNVPNALEQARNPLPLHNDVHVDADSGHFKLKWSKAPEAVSHDVYFGADSAAVAKADKTSELFKGNQTDTSYSVSSLSCLKKYYWRIDEIKADNTRTRGNIWYFIPRRLAFNDAEGYGRYAIGGRGGKVVVVSNLNPTGPGSFYEAVTADIGPRTIVFNVSGIITLPDRTVIKKNVTIAGQTAPGKGICLRARPMGINDECVVRFIRMRLGAGDTYDGIGLAGANYSIMDHCSVSWTIDEAVSSRNGRNITVQRVLISEALNIAGHQNYAFGKAHGYAGSISGDIGSFHHNLLAHNEGRNWSLAGGLDGASYYAGRLDIFNMVVYNYGGRATDGGAHEVNFVNNYYKRGPATSVDYILNAQLEGLGKGSQSYYLSGNIVQATNGTLLCDGTQNQCLCKYSKYDAQVLDWKVFVDKPFFPSYAKIESAKDAYKSVLSDVGCNLPLFDNHDKRVVKETLTGTYTFKGSISKKAGLPDNQSDVGGYEDYPELVRNKNWDSDLDGMPDWWEKIHGLNPQSADTNFSESNADADADGYTNLEEFLEWMAHPNYKINPGQTIIVDLSQYSKGYTDKPVYTATNVVNGNAAINANTLTFIGTTFGLASLNINVSDATGSSMRKAFNFLVIDTTTIAADEKYVSPVVVEPVKLISQKFTESNNIYLYVRNNKLFVSIDSDVADNVRLSIYNMSGVKVLQQLFNIQKGENNFNVHIDAISKGQYIVRVANNKGARTLKMIK